MVLHVVGLQRSGTNYLEQLIRLNVTDDVIPVNDKTICWKHATPYAKNNQRIPVLEVIRSRPEIVICLVAKHPLHWIASVTLRTPRDLFRVRKKLAPDGVPSIPNLVKLYNTFHMSWMNELEAIRPYAFFQYEALLSDPDSAMQQLTAFLGTSYAGQVLVPEKVPYTKEMSEERKAQYLSGYHGLDPAVASEVIRLVDRSVLEMMGYVPEHPPILGEAPARSSEV